MARKMPRPKISRKWRIGIIYTSKTCSDRSVTQAAQRCPGTHTFSKRNRKFWVEFWNFTSLFVIFECGGWTHGKHQNKCALFACRLLCLNNCYLELHLHSLFFIILHLGTLTVMSDEGLKPPVSVWVMRCVGEGDAVKRRGGYRAAE